MENYNELIFSEMITFDISCFWGCVLAPSTPKGCKSIDLQPFVFYRGKGENQFTVLYSFGVSPVRCLNNRVKCCGYLKPNS